MTRLLGAMATTMLLVGCGASAGSTRVSSAQEAIAEEQRSLAPDLAAQWDAAQAAQREAWADGDEARAAQEAERAAFWKAAVQAEAERIEAAREAARVQAEVEAIETARMEVEAQRLEIERKLKRELAANLAREEAQRVLATAESDEARRRGGDAARVHVRLEAQRVRIERADLLLTAAAAMDANADLLQRARDALIEARAKLDGSPASMQRVLTTYALCARALAEARSHRPGPDATELASLLETLRTSGFQAEVTGEGVVVWLDDAFAGASLRPGAITLLTELAAILSAHPHGPVQLRVLAAGGAPIAKRIAQASRRALQALDARLAISSGAGERDALRLTLSAYGTN